jgi:hypothetical protein
MSSTPSASKVPICGLVIAVMYGFAQQVAGIGRALGALGGAGVDVHGDYKILHLSRQSKRNIISWRTLLVATGALIASQP